MYNKSYMAGNWLVPNRESSTSRFRTFFGTPMSRVQDGDSIITIITIIDSRRGKEKETED
jgi:hypothetical protein